MNVRAYMPAAGVPSDTAASQEEVTLRNVETLARIEREHLMQRNPAEKLSDAIARFCGSMPFVWIHVVWFGIWLALNLVPRFHHFDPYPFSFLTLTVSLEAIFLTTFIMISQNRQGELADQRNRLDLQINLLSEQENSKMLTMLESIMHRLGMEHDDPEVRALVMETKPEAILEQINRLAEHNLQETEDSLETETDSPDSRRENISGISEKKGTHSAPRR